MRIIGFTLLLFFLVCIFLVELPALQQEEFSLKHLTPENYWYNEAEGCANCKGEHNLFMPRAAGVNLTASPPALDKRGWLASAHARSQSHGDWINTKCAWCHAPMTKDATQDKEKNKTIPKGTWQGVTCGACHPGSLERNKRESLLINFKPSTDPTKKDSYIFRERGNGESMNQQCRFCHHESHDLLIEAKQEMMTSGEMRCIDCHMAAYAQTEGHIERYHNLKVADNIPHSCSSGLGRANTCHDGVSKDWFKNNLSKVKGPEKEW